MTLHQAKICVGCWQQKNMPIPLRGVLSVPFRAVGIRPPFQFGTADAETARLWAAALAFPIDWDTAKRMTETLDPRLKSQKGLQHA